MKSFAFPVHNAFFKFVTGIQCRSPTPEQISRLLRCRVLMFHSLTFLWHVILNYQTLSGVFYIFFNRIDLVNKTCGFGIQYITIWNQVIEQTYFNACLFQDVLELTTPSDKYPKLKSHLRLILSYAFSSIVFPLAILVTFNFWAIYSYYPRVIDEDNVTESFFPSWVNHGLHTTILLLAFGEKFFVYRAYPDKFWGFLGFSSVLILYCGTCFILYLIGGVWPYPLLSILTGWQVALYIYANITSGYLIMRAGDYFNNKIWGKPSSAGIEMESKKVT